MRGSTWIMWHFMRGHLVTLRRPYDAPVGIVAHCRRCDRVKQFI